MLSLRDASVRWKMGVLTATAVVGLLLFGVVANSTLNELKVNGPVYMAIANSKDLVADYVPPDGCVFEAYGYMVKLEDEKDPAKVQQFVSTIRKKKDDEEVVYKKRWEQTTGQTRSHLENAHQAVNQIYDIFEQSYLPAIQKGNKADAHAIRVTKLSPMFDKHVDEVNGAVAIALKDVTQHESEAASISTSRTMILFGAGILIIAVTFVLSLTISKSILGPVEQLSTASALISKGDLNVNVSHRSGDELGALAEAFRDLAAYIRNVAKGIEAMSAGDMTVRLEAKSANDVLSHSFNNAVGSLEKTISGLAANANALQAAAQEVSYVSGNVQHSAKSTAAQAANVSRALEKIGASVETIAAGAEEMTATVRQIVSDTKEATNISDHATLAMETANTRINQLSASGQQIGSVVNIITEIAKQTHLLALNATMEASRAGYAGKGFAVVAEEVKELAKETAKATEDISEKVTTIQKEAEEVVNSIQQMSTIFNDLHRLQRNTSMALEEQSLASGQVSNTLSEVAQGTCLIGESISEVASAASGTESGVEKTFNAADDLKRMSESLKKVVATFKVSQAA